MFKQQIPAEVMARKRLLSVMEEQQTQERLLKSAGEAEQYKPGTEQIGSLSRFPARRTTQFQHHTRMLELART